MRIEKVEGSITAISDLAPGDVFEYDYEYYIKTSSTADDSGVCSVTNLDSGLLEVLGREAIVERVNAKLVVEG